MNRILCSLLDATLPFGSVLANAPMSKNVKTSCRTFPARASRACSSNMARAVSRLATRILNPPTALEGVIRGQANNGPLTTYEAGQSFSELPGQRHNVSANASETKPAKLLAVFVLDEKETELTIPRGK
jgi:hypothetical protein